MAGDSGREFKAGVNGVFRWLQGAETMTGGFPVDFPATFLAAVSVCQVATLQELPQLLIRLVGWLSREK